MLHPRRCFAERSALSSAGGDASSSGTWWSSTPPNLSLDDEEEYNDASIQHQTRRIRLLRSAVFLLLVSIATVVCVGVYLYTKHEEERSFRAHYDAHADEIMEAFYGAVERKLEAIESMSTAITSYALSNNKTFPFVTLPNFAVLGSAMRVQAEASILHWMPLIEESERPKWEEYAMLERYHIDEAFEQDRELRHQQDVEYGYADGNGGMMRRPRAADEANDDIVSPMDDNRIEYEDNKSSGLVGRTIPQNQTIIQDGTGYHVRIWSNGEISPLGDEPAGVGPYLPLWQRSPVSAAKQELLNVNFAKTKAFQDVLPVVLQTKEAVMHSAEIPLPQFQENFKRDLAISQYRHNMGEVLDDPHTFLGYPVFDSFDSAERRVVGLLADNVYWKLFFKNILPAKSIDMICVLENSFNQTFSYKIEGPEVTFLGEGDPHPAARTLRRTANINQHVERQAGPETRSYTSVCLNQEFGQYRLHIYPASTYRLSNYPWVYAIAMACTFAITSIVYLMFACAVEKRQEHVMHAAVSNARKAATAERELNEFLAHEVRNPLAAAISAHTFVDATVHGTKNGTNHTYLTDKAVQKSLEEDVKVIGSCLHFINDFLRSMLDIHRAAASQMELKLAPADLLKDVLEPVCSMLYQQRDTNVEITLECPQNLIVATDPLRLKQVVLNLGRNATKFVQSGFVRFRAAVVAGMVELYVEDSGPGIPEEKRDKLFQKYQTSLDSLCQGTGIGLCLSKNLMDMLNGNLYLDQEYRSGIANKPGTRFVIQLRRPPEQLSGFFSSSISLCSREADSRIFDMEECSVSEVSKQRECASPAEDRRRPRPELSAASEVSSPTLCLREEPMAQQQHQKELPEGWNVLFVDDDLLMRKVFSRAIQKVAPTWIVDESANGETALRLAGGSTRYDLIFVDQYMASAEKQLLGTETVRALRAKGVTSLLVGLSADQMAPSFIQAGADAFLSKPIACRPDEPRATLCDMIASKRASRFKDAGVAENTVVASTAGSSPATESGPEFATTKQRDAASLETDGIDSPTVNVPAACESNEYPIAPPCSQGNADVSTNREKHSPAGTLSVDAQVSKDNSSIQSQPSIDCRGSGKRNGGTDTSSSSNPLPPNLSIMFVDDDPILRKLFARAVQKVAPTWSIHEAASGERALELVESHQYDLIFMDQYMSSTERKQLLGTETVEALRSRGVTSTLCGLSANELEKPFLSSGADYFLPKPIPCRPHDLKRELHRITRTTPGIVKVHEEYQNNASAFTDVSPESSQFIKDDEMECVV